MNPITCIDFYKADHRRQYPEGTEYIYSNFTARSSMLGDTQVVFFGLQYFIKWFLIEEFNQNFFARPKHEVVTEYKTLMENTIGGLVSYDHIVDLHDLGYIPLRIKALPEGSLVNLKVPLFTVINTNPQFFWLVNYFETIMSATLWKMITSATTAYKYRQLLNKYATDKSFVPFQGHDFSFRGMSGVHDAAMSGAGHLLSFVGTDTVPAIELLNKYYNGTGLVGCSVPATEHSVMCMGGKDGEFDTFKRLITEIYPTGIVSIVSDTWDLWKVIDEYLPRLKSEIENRNGRIVIRPDSGDPVQISIEVIRRLAKNFGVENGRIHKNLGVIYGDSITLSRCEQILEGLKQDGFSSDNMVFGIGSYTYQYCTRDTYGFAMKATWGQVNGEGREIFKDPVTDNGNKKSAKGLLRVNNGILYDQQTKEQEQTGDLKTVFENGKLIIDWYLEEIRERLNKDK